MRLALEINYNFKTNKQMNFKQLLFTSLIAVIVSLSTIYIYSINNKNQVKYITAEQQPTVRLTNYSSGANPGSIDFIDAANKTIHGVVHVKTQYNSDNSSNNNSFYDLFFGQSNPYQNQLPRLGSGSGVIISADGYIITNNHVIKNATKIEVTLNDKRTYDAELVGTDPTSDIALLKIEEKELSFLSYGNSDNLKIGEWVLAVGNPFNLTSTVTAGIVSAKARNINLFSEKYAIESFIQTDAVVNPGNSGGALVNNTGELIGINTAIASQTGSYVGYSFAVPVNIVKKIIADIMQFGEVQRAYIGINIQDMDADKAEELGLDKIEGVYVSTAMAGSAAEKAGIKTDDVITHINNIAINSMSELQEQVSKYRPGDEIDITINRENEQKQFSLVLRNKHGNTDIVKSDDNLIMGVKLSNLSQGDLKRLRIRNGVKVLEISKGKLKNAGIRKNFVITRINQRNIFEVNDVFSILKSSKGGVFIEGVYPDGSVAYYAFGN